MSGPDAETLYDLPELLRTAYMQVDADGVMVTISRQLLHKAADHIEALRRRIDDKRLVRELDVALNGAGAAPQASLCDIVSQVQTEGIKSPKFKPI